MGRIALMRKLVCTLPALACALALPSGVTAQPPPGGPADRAARGQPEDSGSRSLVTRMMAFDRNKDGKLVKDEVTDARLHRLFDRADSNKDGVVTREELSALAARLEAEFGPGGERGGPGGFGGGRRGGPGRGPGGFGGPPRPGQVLSPFLRERLNLTPEQNR